jgi:hypothetical protein
LRTPGQPAASGSRSSLKPAVTQGTRRRVDQDGFDVLTGGGKTGR